MEAVKSERKQKSDTKPRRPVQEKEWLPSTDLGRLVKAGKVSMEDIAKYSLRIKESEIVEFLFGKKLKEEIICIRSVQKQTKAGQRTRMKVVAAVGTGDGYLGIGSKSAKEVATAMKGALSRAKCALKPVLLGHWAGSFGAPHTVPVKATGKVSSVLIRLIPAPKGSGLVAGNIPKKILTLAGVKDIFTSSKGQTSTTENFAYATAEALDEASKFYRPAEWIQPEAKKNPLLLHSDLLMEMENKMKF